MSFDLFYEERGVPGELNRQLQCAWYFRRAANAETIDTVYPDGCCELILHLAEAPMARSLDQDWRQQGRCLFAGQIRQGFQMKSDHPVVCLGIRLQPAASAALGLLKLARTRDCVINLQSSNPPLADKLLSTVAGHSPQDASWPDLDPLWQAIAPLLKDFRPDERIESALAQIHQASGQDPISRLASQVGMSLRGFQQKFRDQVGLTAKEYARVIRLQATLALLDAEEQPLSRVAAEAGFSDQAHANRELKRVTGLTPRTLQSGLSNHRDDMHTLQMAAAFIRGYGMKQEG